jgi:hypothetical protein
MLPELAQRQPFLRIVHSEDTHRPFYIDEAFSERRPDLETWPKSRASFDYVDLLIKRLMAGVQAFRLENSAEIMVYADHLVREPEARVHSK